MTELNLLKEIESGEWIHQVSWHGNKILLTHYQDNKDEQGRNYESWIWLELNEDNQYEGIYWSGYFPIDPNWIHDELAKDKESGNAVISEIIDIATATTNILERKAKAV